MNLLFVTEYFPPAIFGGGELSAYYLAKEVTALGHNVTVLTSTIHDEKEEEHMDGIRVLRRVKTGKNPSSLLGNLTRATRFNRSLKKETLLLTQTEKFDVIHCLNMTSMTLAQIKQKLDPPLTAHLNSPLPICPKADRVRYGKQCTVNCTIHTFLPCFLDSSLIGKMNNHWYLRYNPLFWTVIYSRYKRLKKTLGRFDALISISDYMNHEFKPFTNQPITTVHNIIPLDTFGKTTPQRPSTNQKPKILYYGSLLESKGLPVLLDALKQLPPNSFECHAYGNGPLKDKLKTSGLVTVHEPVNYDQLPNILTQHDIVVLPAIWPEPFGRVVIETMAAGKPIIASRIGGIPELIEDGKTGILVEPNNAESLADTLRILTSQPQKMVQMGVNAKASIERFAPQNLANRFITTVNGLIRSAKL